MFWVCCAGETTELESATIQKLSYGGDEYQGSVAAREAAAESSAADDQRSAKETETVTSASEAPADKTANPFDGRWFRKAGNTSYVGTIREGVLFYRRTVQMPCHAITQLSADSIQMLYEGAPVKAQVIDRELRWDDGDVWVKNDVGLEGEWYHDGRHQVSIKGTWAFWNPARFAAHSKPFLIMPAGDGNYQMNLGNSLFGGQLNGTKLTWSDGQVWERRQNTIDGDWYEAKSLQYKAAIRGDTILFQKGSAVPLSANGENVVKMTIGSEAFEGKVEGNRITWGDGEVWIGDC